MKTIPWAHDKNLSKTLSFPWRDAVQEGTSPRLKGECIPRNRVPNMQNECFQSQATPDSPIKWDKSQRAETIHDALREFSGCTYDVPRIPPCVQQPGIPARSRRSAPCQLDERWNCLHKSVPVLESCRCCATRRIPFCSPRAAQKSGMLRLA